MKNRRQAFCLSAVSHFVNCIVQYVNCNTKCCVIVILPQRVALATQFTRPGAIHGASRFTPSGDSRRKPIHARRALKTYH